MKRLIGLLIATIASSQLYGCGGAGTSAPEEKVESHSDSLGPTCHPPDGDNQSNYSGANCTGIEYAVQFPDGSKHTWDGGGCVGTAQHTSFAGWWKDRSGRCSFYPNYYPSTSYIVYRP